MDLGTNQVLVAGASGWLGRGLLHALTRGLSECEALREPQVNLRIRALVLPGEDEESVRKISGQIEVVVGDIRKPQDCTFFCQDAAGSILFNTAGIIHPRWVRDYYQINVKGTKNLLNAAISAGVRRAVVVSSNSPCGCNPHLDHRFDEESPYNPYMGYGRSKMLMELNVKEIQRMGKIETVIIRCPWFYGPFQPPRQTTFFEMIRDGMGPVIGGGENLRSMVYIANLSQGLILAAMTQKANGQLYWIADERPYSMNEIINTIERLLETEFGQPCKHKRLKLPGFASEIAQLVDWCLQKLGLYHQKIHVLSEMNKTIVCSILKSKRELCYNPTITLEEGMRRSLTCVFNSSFSPISYGKPIESLGDSV